MILILFAFATSSPFLSQVLFAGTLVEEIRKQKIDVTDSLESDVLAEKDLSEIHSKKFVFLGEGNHYNASKYRYRLMFIRALFARGIHMLGMEMGRSDARHVNRYLQTGNQDHLRRVALYRIKPGTAPDGSLIPGNPLAAREIAFLRVLRKLNEDHIPGSAPLSWYSFDLDMYPGGGFQDLFETLAPFQSREIVKDLIRALEIARTEPTTPDRPRSACVSDLLKFYEERQTEISKTVGAAVALDIRESIWNLMESYVFEEQLGAGKYREALERREYAMAHAMNEVISNNPTDTRFMLMGHNFHFSKDYSQIFEVLEVNGKPTDVPMWYSLGTDIHRKFSSDIYSVWMLHHEGFSTDPGTSNPVETLPVPGSFNDSLAQAGEFFLLPVAKVGSGYMDQLYLGVHNQNELGRYRPSEQVDLIYFTRKLSPL
jgi:erythromycin esterase-like protein